MELLFFVLLLKISLIRATVFSYKFTRFMSPCAMTHSVYYNITGVSDVRCVSLCYNNPFGTCDRFVWDPNERTCFLHSTIVNTSKEITLTNDMGMTFSKFLQECNGAGYDFDSVTHTCLKYHVLETGLTWKQSRARCQQEGGDLISIATKEKWDLVTNYVRKCAGDFWVGLKSRKWLTGEDFGNEFGANLLLNNYDGGFPDDPEMDCGLLYSDGGNPIQDMSCNMRVNTKFLCEIFIL